VAARPSAQFQRVLELRSDAAMVQKALILDGKLVLARGVIIGGSFTVNSTRDNNSLNCCDAISSVFTPVQGDPRELTWGPTNDKFRHKLVLFDSMPELYRGEAQLPHDQAVGQHLVTDRGAGHQRRRRRRGRLVR